MVEAKKVYDSVISGEWSKSHVYSVEYESHGLLFAMQILGTKAEAEMHADNLGCYEPERVDCNIPLMGEYRS